jgi:hypothetical protein
MRQIGLGKMLLMEIILNLNILNLNNLNLKLNWNYFNLKLFK